VTIGREPAGVAVLLSSWRADRHVGLPPSKHELFGPRLTARKLNFRAFRSVRAGANKRRRDQKEDCALRVNCCNRVSIFKAYYNLRNPNNINIPSMIKIETARKTMMGESRPPILTFKI